MKLMYFTENSQIEILSGIIQAQDVQAGVWSITETIQNEDSTQWLRLTFGVVCAEDLYGPSCTKYCAPRQNDRSGHYSCDPKTGEAICLPGWEKSNSGLCTQRRFKIITEK